MNNREIDQLFKERFKGYKETPPQILWEKLQNKMRSRKQKAWWQLGKVAAILLLIACSVYLLNFWNTTTDTKPLAGEIEKPAIGPAVKEIASDDDPKGQASESFQLPDAGIAGEQTKTPGKQGPSGNLKSEPRVSKSPAPTADINKLANHTNKNHRNADQNKLIEPSFKEPVNQPLAVTVRDDLAGNESPPQPSPKRPRVTITYKKSPSPPEPTLALVSDNDEDDTAIKWLWQKAQDIKHSDLGMGAIRAAKDQLLVFDKENKEKELKAN